MQRPGHGRLGRGQQLVGEGQVGADARQVLAELLAAAQPRDAGDAGRHGVAFGCLSAREYSVWGETLRSCNVILFMASLAFSAVCLLQLPFHDINSFQVTPFDVFIQAQCFATPLSDRTWPKGLEDFQKHANDSKANRRFVQVACSSSDSIECLPEFVRSASEGRSNQFDTRRTKAALVPDLSIFALSILMYWPVAVPQRSG